MRPCPLGDPCSMVRRDACASAETRCHELRPCRLGPTTQHWRFSAARVACPNAAVYEQPSRIVFFFTFLYSLPSQMEHGHARLGRELVLPRGVKALALKAGMARQQEELGLQGHSRTPIKCSRVSVHCSYSAHGIPNTWRLDPYPLGHAVGNWAKWWQTCGRHTVGTGRDH